MSLKIYIPEEYCAEAKKQMKDLVTLLNKDTTVGKIDEAALMLLGSYMNLYYTADLIVRTEGAIRKKKNSNVSIVHPAVKVMNESGAKMYRLLIEFGMTPRAREKSGKEPEDAATSAFDQFLGQKVERR